MLSPTDFASLLKEIPAILNWRKNDQKSDPFIISYFFTSSSDPKLTYSLLKELKEEEDFSDREKISLRSLFGVLSAVGYGCDRNEADARANLSNCPSLEALLFVGQKLCEFERSSNLSSQPIGFLARFQRWSRYLLSGEKDLPLASSSHCAVCNKTASSKCPCGTVQYCSTVCQKQDWPRHKEQCPKRKK
jgi:hypothetical protein